MKITWPVALWICGVAMGVGLGRWATNRQVAHLKQQGDSAQAAALARDYAATAFSDSLVQYIDSLKQTKKPVTIKIAMDSAAAARAAQAVAAATTARDSNVALVAEVTALASENTGLRINARTDSLTLWAAMRRGDSLATVLHDQTQEVVRLNALIQQLNSHTLPTWARVSFEVIRTGFAVKGIADVVAGK